MVGQLVRFFIQRDSRMQQLVAEMRGLSKHIASIEAVSRATRILALNANIEAARAGSMDSPSPSSPTKSARWPISRRPSPRKSATPSSS